MAYRIKKEFKGQMTRSDILNKMVEISDDNINIHLADKRFDLLELEGKKPLKPVVSEKVEEVGGDEKPAPKKRVKQTKKD